MSWWDDLTNTISEIDDYVVGIGKGIASATVGNTADAIKGYVENIASGFVNTSVGAASNQKAPNIKVKLPKTELNTLGEDWFNESAKAKDLTWNVIDTPVSYVLNTSTQLSLAQKLIKENPGKYTGVLGLFDAMGKVQEQAFGKRENLAWYEQDPNRVQYGEIVQGAFDENAPLFSTYEERIKYWQSQDKLDDVMWTTLGAMIIADPLNFIPGGQAKQIENVRNIQNVIDALNDAKTTDEAMEIVKGFNWQERLPLAADPEAMKRSELYQNKLTSSDVFFGPSQKPIDGETYQLDDIKKIKKQILELQKNEIRRLVDELDLEKIQREVSLMATMPRKDLLIKGSQEYKDTIDEMFPMFTSYSDLPEDVRLGLPEQSGYYYSHVGNDVWAISNGQLLQWVPKVAKGTVKRVEESEDLFVRGIKDNIKTTKEIKTTGGKWRVVNVIPKYELNFFKKIVQKQPTVPEEIMRDVTFYTNKGMRNKGNEFIAQVGFPTTDSYLLRFPIFRNEFITGTRSDKVLPPRVEGITYPFSPGVNSQAGVTYRYGLEADPKIIEPRSTVGINFDPEKTKFIEVTIKDKNGKPRRLQLAIVDSGVNAGVYHLDFYSRTEKPKPTYKPLTDEQVDELVAKGLGNIVGDRKRAEVATNLLNRMTPEEFAAMKGSTEGTLNPEMIDGVKKDPLNPELNANAQWILKYSDEEFVANLDKIDVVEKEMKLAEVMQNLHYDPKTGDFLDSVDEDVDTSNFFYMSLDDISVTDFGDEFGDGIEDAFSKFDQGINVVKGPKLETTQLKRSERMPVWVYDNNFRWDKVDSYSGIYINPITGKRNKFEVSSKYKLINPAEVANGDIPRFIDVQPSKGKSLGPEGTIYTLGVTGDIIRFDDLNVERMVYEKNLLNLKMSRAEFEKSLVLERGKRTIGERKASSGIKPLEESLDIEELKITDPYRYESLMEQTYGVPREVTFGFKIKRGYSHSPTTVSLVRTTQEFAGYGAKDYYDNYLEPVEEIVHTWTIQPEDFKTINNRMYESGGLTVTSKGFRTRFLGETIDEDSVAIPLKLNYQDLDRFAEPRWESTEMTISDTLRHFDNEIKILDTKMSEILTYIQRNKDNPYRADGVASQRVALENFGVRRRQLIASRAEMTDNWMAAGEQYGTNRLFITPTPSYFEVQFKRWISALNYYGKANADILDNLPTTSQELDALRKGLIDQVRKDQKIVRFQNIDNDPNGIFVFGSNLAGRHGKGAALDAKNVYGAVQGVGKGLTGRSYALPTKGKDLEKLSLDDIKYYVDEFISFAQKNPDKTFYVTSFGTGLAGNKVEDIAAMFDRIPSNVKFTAEPNGSRNILGTAINDLANGKPAKVTEPEPMTWGKVVRVKDNVPGAIYIGRAGRGETGEFGNPFPVENNSDEAVKEAVAKYDTWLAEKIKTDPEYANKIYALKGKTLACPGKEANEICHGQSILKAIKYLHENPELLNKISKPVQTSSKIVIHSGGAIGADRAWAVAADQLGIETKAHSFKDHIKSTDWANAPKLEERVIHTQEEFKNITNLVKKAGNAIYGKSNVGYTSEAGQLVHRNAFQVINSEAVICVTEGLKKLPNGEFTVGGRGTPWAAEIAKQLKKPLYNYSQSDEAWLQFNYETREWDYIDMPPKFNTFAGVGSRTLTSKGKQAISDYLQQFKKAE